MNTNTVQCLLSLPASSSSYYSQSGRESRQELFCSCDPPGGKLGSGGGSVQMLVEGWRATGAGQSFSEWLAASRKLIVLGGGQSRRLPAYAAAGKPFIPIPVLQGTFGQRLDQTLIDLQLDAYRNVLARAPQSARVMITSGDVLLRFGDKLPPCPDVDVLMLGMQVDPETASHFGVFFLERTAPNRLAFFLQKPSKQRIRELAADYHFLVDTGMWILSERAVAVLRRRCGWDEAHGQFADGRPALFELYSKFGLSLGERPELPDAEIQALSCRAVALADPEFYHLGTSRQLIESVCEMQNREARKIASGAARIYPEQVIQNSVFEAAVRQEGQRMLWVENSTVPASWRIASGHVITGVPDNDWDLALEPGVCLDFVPVGDSDFCVRSYGIDDAFNGPMGGPAATTWFGRPAAAWLQARGITWEQAGIAPQTDIYQAPLFPVVSLGNLKPTFLEWLFAAAPLVSADFSRQWAALPRLSAEEINQRANLARAESQREVNRSRGMLKMYENRRSSVFFRLDLDETARLYASGGAPLPSPIADKDPMALIHDHMWRAAVLRYRGQQGAEQEEKEAFNCLRDAILEDVRQRVPAPRCNVLADQIVWGRSPARLDFGGGWTDTPPYCLQHGGRVCNVAVDLNGQPPIQVFAKLSPRREIVIRSIDLGVEQRITSFEQLASYDQIGSEFTLAKAALVLAGFMPGFYHHDGHATLDQMLQDFGGGIELSLLAAIPQGSGLGTSSILAATLLGTLSELCGLLWDTQEIIMRTMALEQMLTTGGGWQDQVGGILRGVKLIQTTPGLLQHVTARWLPDYLLSDTYANRRILLYYTGVTRLAKNILQEIVRGMFLNSTARLGILKEIGENADFVSSAIQQIDWEGFCEGIRRSWDLNQRLDSGTNTPAIQAILDPIQDYLSACKLLGAGGGGYMVMCAKDEMAALRIRQILTQQPPNPKARFVDLSVSRLGLEITRS